MTRLVIAVAALALVGCTGTIEAPAAPATCADVGDWLYDCRLQDGTRCVVYAGSAGAGVSCDWRHDSRSPE